MWCTPRSLPMRTAVALSTLPFAARFCSATSLSSWSRSTTRIPAFAESSLVRMSAIPPRRGSSSSCALPIAPLLKCMTATVGRASDEGDASCARADGATSAQAAIATTARLANRNIVLLRVLNGQCQSFRGSDDGELAASPRDDRAALLHPSVHFVVGALWLVVEEHQLLDLRIERQLDGVLVRRMSPP